MSKLRVLIVDDEPLGRARLRELLGPELDVDIVGECVDGAEAVDGIREKSPDLVFLDVKMPVLDGFGVLNTLTGRLPAIIFVTAHHEFAVQAFDAAATDYLLKPLDRTRLRNALQRVRGKQHSNAVGDTMATIQDLLQNFTQERPAPMRLSVRNGNRVSLVNVSQIDWIRGADNYAELHVGAKVHLLRQTLDALERQLPRNQFMRISRSFIVKADQVVELFAKKHGDYELLLRGGTRLTGSRKYRRDLLRLLGKLQ